MLFSCGTGKGGSCRRATTSKGNEAARRSPRPVNFLLTLSLYGFGSDVCSVPAAVIRLGSGPGQSSYDDCTVGNESNASRPFGRPDFQLRDSSGRSSRRHLGIRGGAAVGALKPIPDAQAGRVGAAGFSFRPPLAVPAPTDGVASYGTIGGRPDDNVRIGRSRS